MYPRKYIIETTMSSRKSSLAILAITSIFLLFNLAAAFEHDLTTHNLTHGGFVQDTSFFASPGLVYGSCHDMANHDGKFSAKCTFVMETSQPVDSVDHLRVCDYELNNKVKPREHLSLKSVVALSEHKAVVVFESYDTYRYFVLHFAYAVDVPCKGFRVDMDRDLKAMVFALQHDKFELVTTDGPHCENNKRCRVIVDSHGHIHEATHNWLFNDHSNLIAVVPSPFTERLVIDEYNNVMRLYAADHLGMSRLIKEYDNRGSNDESDGRRYVSTTYERVSMCTKHKRTLICAQYDLDSEKLFETELMYTQFTTVNLLKVHNTPNGGLLLVLASCSTKQSSFCDEDLFSFYVTKIDPRGRQIGTVRVDKFARVAPEKLHLFENEHGKLCLSHVFNDWKSDDTTVLDVFCFDDGDFNKGFVYGRVSDDE